MVDWVGFRNTLDFHVDLDLRDRINNLLRCLELELVGILVFVSILLGFFEVPEVVVVGEMLDSLKKVSGSTVWNLFGL